MSCPSDSTLGSFVAGTLAPAERAQVESHVGGCERCSRRARALATASQAHAETVESSPEDATLAASQWLGFPLLFPGEVVGRYTVIRRVGAGGMGIVYAAHDRELRRDVALKFLRTTSADPNSKPRLTREAQAMAKLSHPNVVSVFDVGSINDQVFCAMEFIEGISLAEWLAQTPRSTQEIVRVFLAAARGLAAAHEAGIVHRDFKPSNVIVDRRGEVKVVDFGLARSRDLAATRPPQSAASSAPVGDAATLEGVIAGTPAYMSPEQHRGDELDARTDQFSFCVALFEALYRQRPFSGDSVDELRSAVEAGQVSLDRSRVTRPAWLRKIVLRGLQSEPSDRYPSMQALIEDLAKDPMRVRRRIAAVVGVVTLSLVSVVATLAWQESATPCKGADARFDGIWDDAKREVVRTAFLGTGKVFAESAWKGSSNALDAFRREWVKMHHDACVATRIRKDQSEELLDLRMACLENRRQEMSALVRLFLKPDAAVVERATMAALSLAPVRTCGDRAWLLARVKPPADPKGRAKVEEILRELSALKALRYGGRYRPALERATDVVKKARALGHLPTLADTLVVKGKLQELTGDNKGAVQTLLDTVLKAEAGRHDRAKVRAYAELVHLMRLEPARHRRARRWAALGRAALERLGGDDQLEAELNRSLGAVLARVGRHRAALKEFHRARRLFQRRFGEADVRTARINANIAISLRKLGRFGEALSRYRGALAAIRTTLGASHPEVAKIHNNVGNLLSAMGRNKEALGHMQRAVAVGERALGSHRNVAVFLNNLGLVSQRMGRYRESLVYVRRALALHRRLGSLQSAFAASAMQNLGVGLWQLGRLGEGARHLARAVDVRRKVLGPQNPRVADALADLAEVQIDQGAHAEALASLREAAAIWKRSERHRRRLARAEIAIGEVLLAAGRAGEAERELSRVRNAASRLPSVRPRFAAAFGAALLGAGRAPEAVRFLQAESAIAMRSGGAKATRPKDIDPPATPEEAKSVDEVKAKEERPTTGGAGRAFGSGTSAGSAIEGFGSPKRAVVPATPAARAAKADPKRAALAVDRARVQAILARALRSTGKDRERARRLAESAEKTFRRAGARGKRVKRRLDSWLRTK